MMRTHASNPAMQRAPRCPLAVRCQAMQPPKTRLDAVAGRLGAATVSPARALNGACVVQLTGMRKAESLFKSHPNPDASLNEYMKHASQHFEKIPLPLGGRFKQLDGNRLEMLVPKIQLFDIWLQPKVITNVRVVGGRAEITSTTEDCVLSGSQHVDSLGLNDRFNLDVRIVLTWDGSAATQAAKHHKLSVASNLMVEVDVPPPFSFMPKPVIKAAGDAALVTVLAAIADNVLGKLSKDYDAWARSLPLPEKKKGEA